MKLPVLTVSDTTVQYSPTMVLNRGQDIVFGYVHAGTVVATAYVQVGISIPETLTTAAYVLWKTTTRTFDTLPAGSDCSDSETFNVGGYKLVRLKITPASGAGTIALFADIKD